MNMQNSDSNEGRVIMTSCKNLGFAARALIDAAGCCAALVACGSLFTGIAAAQSAVPAILSRPAQMGQPATPVEVEPPAEQPDGAEGARRLEFLSEVRPSKVNSDDPV